MSPALQQLLVDARSRLVVLDSNLLLLWITAKHNLSLLNTFRRVQMFTPDDAQLLTWIIDQFAGIVTTPHLLAEASNLANGLNSWARLGWFEDLAEFALRTPEVFVKSDVLSKLPEFVRFGVADAALCNLSEEHRILTTDARLSEYLNSLGRPGLNFADLRAMVV